MPLQQELPVQLSSPLEEGQLQGDYFVEPIIKGYRGVVIFKNKQVVALSHNKDLIANSTPLIEELRPLFQTHDVVLDGVFDAERFYVFDIIDFNDWESEASTFPLWARKSDLFFSGLDSLKRTVCVPYIRVDKPSYAYLKTLGGVVAKPFDAPYRFRNTTDWRTIG